jgi:hypothetical protein
MAAMRASLSEGAFRNQSIELRNVLTCIAATKAATAKPDSAVARRLLASLPLLRYAGPSGQDVDTQEGGNDSREVPGFLSWEFASLLPTLTQAAVKCGGIVSACGWSAPSAHELAMRIHEEFSACLDGIVGWTKLKRAVLSFPDFDCGPLQARMEQECVLVRVWLRRCSENEPAPPVPALTDEDTAILLALKNSHPTTITQENLADLTSFSERTVRTHVKYLREKSLIDQPRGPKSGYALTDAGLSVLPRQ